MYLSFRENNENLPGDDEILKNPKPSIKISLLPFKSDIPALQLPKLPSSLLILQPNMSIEVLKKYVLQKLEGVVTSIEELSILYKNQDVHNDYTLRDIERIYGFTSEKTVFHFIKKNIGENNINNI